MRLPAPHSSRRTRVSANMRPPPLAFVPLIAGFFGAISIDHAFGDRAEAAPPPSTATTVDDADAPAAVDETGAQAPAARGLELEAAVQRSEGHLIAPYGDSTAVLTRDPSLEDKLKKMLVDGQTPYGATVLLEAETGRILAIAEYSTRGDSKGIALRPMAPAASVFKLVTTAALLEEGVNPQSSVCTHGGRTRMQADLLVDNAKRDRVCTTFADVLPHSQNVAIAKLALKHLDPERLRSEAQSFGFSSPVPLDVKLGASWGLSASSANIPEDPFGFANAAAGFGEVQISALHGALMASIIANQGLLVPPRMVESVEEGTATAPRRRASNRVISASVAQKLKTMMTDTVTEGTGRRVFSMAPRLPVSAAGKTGSLANYDTGLDTSWFVGFAPADKPEVIVATMVVNTAKWHVKAPFVAKEAMRAYFQAHPAPKKGAVVAVR